MASVMLENLRLYGLTAGGTFFLLLPEVCPARARSGGDGSVPLGGALEVPPFPSRVSSQEPVAPVTVTVHIQTAACRAPGRPVEGRGRLPSPGALSPTKR